MIEHNHTGRPRWGRTYGNRFLTARRCKTCRGYFYKYNIGSYLMPILNKYKDKIYEPIFYEHPLLKYLKSKHTII